MVYMKTWTTLKIRKSKGVERIACVTAYDAAFARLFDQAGIPFILIGDSVGNNVLGYETPVPVTMDDMVHHTAAVTRVVREALVVADLPFLSYQVSDEEGMVNAGRLIQEGGADAVKLEGGAFRAPLVRKLTQNGIPVCAHIGLTPQSVLEFGGYSMHGKEPAEAAQLVEDAKALADAGAFAIVLECVPDSLGAKITETISIPTIGIGGGPSCDGQILVMHDLLGLNSPECSPKFARRYAELGATVTSAIGAYISEVRSGAFPPPRVKKAK